MIRAAFLALAVLAGCQTLDRSTKVACDTSLDCVGLGARCENKVCVGLFGSLYTPPTGYTGYSGPTGTSSTTGGIVQKKCLEASECQGTDVCVDGACVPMQERDYDSTRAAFRAVVCKAALDICGEAKMQSTYGASYASGCQTAKDAPWHLTIGPSSVAIGSWDAKAAAACVADTRAMLVYGLRARSFSSLPDACVQMGDIQGDYDGKCSAGQIECSVGRYCSKPLTNATGEWPCIYPFAEFGETCMDRYSTGGLLAQIKDPCKSGLYCDMGGNGTCRRRIEPGKPCSLQSYANDPVFDPCTSGYMCSETEGTCVPFVPTCPLE